MSTKKHYSIRKNVDLPRSGQSYGQLLPLKNMDVGDSFSFPPADERRVKALVDTYGKKNGAAFLITYNGDGAECWRTA